MKTLVKAMNCSLLLTLVLLVGVSCSTQPLPVEPPRTMEITRPGVINYPVIADLIVDQTKVKGEWMIALDHLQTTSPTEQQIERTKSLAVINALESTNADILILPTYRISKEKVSVTGYPARYQNFRQVTKEELELLKNWR